MAARADGSLHRSDGRLRTSLAAVAGCGAVLVFGAIAVAGPGTALSVGLGAALAVGNLWALARIVAALLPTDESGADAQSRAAWGVVALLKMVGLLGAAWLLMSSTLVAPLPLLVGFGCLPIGIAIGSLVSDRNAAPEDR
jgi:ATP synthase I chain